MRRHFIPITHSKAVRDRPGPRLKSEPTHPKHGTFHVPATPDTSPTPIVSVGSHAAPFPSELPDGLTARPPVGRPSPTRRRPRSTAAPVLRHPRRRFNCGWFGSCPVTPPADQPRRSAAVAGWCAVNQHGPSPTFEPMPPCVTRFAPCFH